MSKRQSTTVKMTTKVLAYIHRFCRTTGQGVIVRHRGIELGITIDDISVIGGKVTLSSELPDWRELTIPKSTIDQILSVMETMVTTDKVNHKRVQSVPFSRFGVQPIRQHVFECFR